MKGVTEARQLHRVHNVIEALFFHRRLLPAKGLQLRVYYVHKGRLRRPLRQRTALRCTRCRQVCMAGLNAALWCTERPRRGSEKTAVRIHAYCRTNRACLRSYYDEKKFYRWAELAAIA